MDKPTIEQVAWVFSKLIKDIGSFRYLIYDKMGFTEDNYLELYEAGGMAINNALVEMYYDDSYGLIEKESKMVRFMEQSFQ